MLPTVRTAIISFALTTLPIVKDSLTLVAAGTTTNKTSTREDRPVVLEGEVAGKHDIRLRDVLVLADLLLDLRHGVAVDHESLAGKTGHEDVLLRRHGC